MMRKRIRVRPKVERDRVWMVEILPLDPRDDLVVRAKKSGRWGKAA